MADGSASGRVASALRRVRDRRRRVRQRLEEIFSREVLTSVVVGGSMAKMVETGVVPAIDPTRSVDLSLFFAWVATFCLSVLASVYWERLQKAAEVVGDAAEEAVEEKG